MATKPANQDPPESRMSWARVPGQIEEIDQPEEGEVFRQVVTAQLYEDGTVNVTIGGRMTYGSQGRTTSASIEADLSNDPDAKGLTAILTGIQGRYQRQLKRRLNRDAVLATGSAVREGEENEEDN